MDESHTCTEREIEAWKEREREKEIERQALMS